MREEVRSGTACLDAVTQLLQRRRLAHPTRGTYEAAELQFWWGRPRATDTVDQLVWFDDEGPAAAAPIYDFTSAASLLYSAPTLCLFWLPDVDPDWIRTVIGRALEHVASLGFETIELEIPRDDETTRQTLAERGFAEKEADVLVDCWLAAGDQQPVTELADGYRLTSRAERMDRPHHMNRDADDPLQERLLQLSLYRPEHDLLVVDADDNHAAHGMFWFDPVTSTGVVEPMRTADEHQQRGLARHILTAGVDRLIAAGAERVSIGYDPANPASGHLYRSVGFVPDVHTDLWSGPTALN